MVHCHQKPAFPHASVHYEFWELLSTAQLARMEHGHRTTGRMPGDNSWCALSHYWTDLGRRTEREHCQTDCTSTAKEAGKRAAEILDGHPVQRIHVHQWVLKGRDQSTGSLDGMKGNEASLYSYWILPLCCLSLQQVPRLCVDQIASGEHPGSRKEGSNGLSLTNHPAAHQDR